MIRILKWVAVVVVLLVIVGGGVTVLVPPMLSEPVSNTDNDVWTKTVALGNLTEVVSAPGRVEPLTKVEISARVSARILKLPFREGEQVFCAKDDTEPSLLIELDASDIQAQLESAQKSQAGLVAQIEVEKQRIAGLEASLKGTKTALDDAQRELERQRSLRETRDVSKRELEQAERTYHEAQSRYDAEQASLKASRLGLKVSHFNVEAADADIKQIRENLAYTTIYSPINGIVTKLNVDVGEIAVTGTMNNPGTVLLEVANLSRMLVVARIDESNIRDVMPGQPVAVRLVAYPDQVFKGKVQSVALAATDQQGQHFETKVLLDEDATLKRTGLSADVEIQVQAHEQVVLVPSQSVLSRRVDSLPAKLSQDNPLIDPSQANTIVVYRLVDGQAVATPVRIGASDNLNTVVLEGLEAGAELITGPYAILESLAHSTSVNVTRRDGKAVTTVNDSTEAGKDTTDPPTRLEAE